MSSANIESPSQESVEKIYKELQGVKKPTNWQTADGRFILFFGQAIGWSWFVNQQTIFGGLLALEINEKQYQTQNFKTLKQTKEYLKMIFPNAAQISNFDSLQRTSEIVYQIANSKFDIHKWRQGWIVCHHSGIKWYKHSHDHPKGLTPFNTRKKAIEYLLNNQLIQA